MVAAGAASRLASLGGGCGGRSTVVAAGAACASLRLAGDRLWALARGRVRPVRLVRPGCAGSAGSAERFDSSCKIKLMLNFFYSGLLVAWAASISCLQKLWKNFQISLVYALKTANARYITWYDFL